MASLPRCPEGFPSSAAGCPADPGSQAGEPPRGPPPARPRCRCQHPADKLQSGGPGGERSPSGSPAERAGSGASARRACAPGHGRLQGRRTFMQISTATLRPPAVLTNARSSSGAVRAAPSSPTPSGAGSAREVSSFPYGVHNFNNLKNLTSPAMIGRRTWRYLTLSACSMETPRRSLPGLTKEATSPTPRQSK